MTEREQVQKRKKRVFWITVCVAAGAGLYAALALLGIGLSCPIRQVTGLQCPGCGNSRAALALLRFDFAASFQYNPLFMAQAGYILWVYVISCIRYVRGKRPLYEPPLPWMDIVLLVVFLGWGILRNIL